MVRYVARYADPELYELVSHLRSELSEQNKEMRALQAKNEMLKDEIERLQAEVDLMRRMDEPTLIALQQKDAEIERLRGNQDVIVQNAALTGEVMLLKAEIKQLRTELNRTRDAVDSIADERDIFKRTLDKRDLEVERLQQDVKYYRELLKAAKGS